MNPKKVKILRMELDEFSFASCIAHFGVGSDWATLFDITSKIEGRGHATTLLREAKAFYETQGKKFGGTVALNPRMKRIYKRLQIDEYR